MFNQRLNTLTLLSFTILAAVLSSNSVPVMAAAPVWSTPPLPLTLPSNVDYVSEQNTVINAKGQVMTAWVQGTQLQAKARVGNKWGNPIAISSANHSHTFKI